MDPPRRSRLGSESSWPGPIKKLNKHGMIGLRSSLSNVKETSWAPVITINVPIVYMARDVMILMRAISITRAIGSGGP
jgi:hypothetical protein